MGAEATTSINGIWGKLEGQVVDGQFPLRRFLGSSEHSGVFLTESAKLASSNVALKLVSVASTRAESQLARWHTAAAVLHPNLMHILDVGRCNVAGVGNLYAVMEYADQDLAQLLQHRALTEEETREMLVPALSVLAFLHEKKLVVGRLKPSNFLVVGDQLKLASDTVRTVGEVDDIKALSAYDPPEARDGYCSTASDIWALGVTICEALTRRQPLGLLGSAGAVVLPPDLPPAFREIVAWCLKRRPQDRPDVAEIDAWLSGQPVEGVAEESMPDDLTADALTAEALKAEALKAEALKAETLRAETLKAGTLRAGTLRGDALKAEASMSGGLPPGASAPGALTAEDSSSTTTVDVELAAGLKSSPAPKTTHAVPTIASPASPTAPPAPLAPMQMPAASKPAAAAPVNAPATSKSALASSTAAANPPLAASRASPIAAPAPAKIATAAQKGAASPPSPAPVAQKGAATAPSSAPVAQKGAATAPSPAPVAQKGAASPPSPAPAAQKGAATAPSPAPVAQKGAATAPSPAPVAQKGAASPPSPAPVAQKGAATAPSPAPIAQKGAASPPSPAPVAPKGATPAPAPASTSPKRPAPAGSNPPGASTAAAARAAATSVAAARLEAASKSRLIESAAAVAAARARADDGDVMVQPRRSLVPLVLGVVVVIAVVWGGIRLFGTDPTPQPTIEAANRSGAESPAVGGATPPSTSATRSTPPQSAAAASTKALAGKKGSNASAAKAPAAASNSSAGAHEVVPDIPPRALRTIRGTVRVSVRLIVEQDGTVFAALAEQRGPSRYFERKAIEAAKQWTFPPADASAQRLMLVKFSFTRGGTTAEAAPLK